VRARSHDHATIRFVDVDGARLRTSVRGSGPPVLLITGLGASLDFGVPFERELAARRLQVISLTSLASDSRPHTAGRGECVASPARCAT
jgi:hypothetical protein